MDIHAYLEALRTEFDKIPADRIVALESIGNFVANSLRENERAALQRAGFSVEKSAGNAKRISLPYSDPKDFDGTNREHHEYNERCREIARDLFRVFHNLRLDR